MVNYSLPVWGRHVTEVKAYTGLVYLGTHNPLQGKVLFFNIELTFLSPPLLKAKYNEVTHKNER